MTHSTSPTRQACLCITMPCGTPPIGDEPRPRLKLSPRLPCLSGDPCASPAISSVLSGLPQRGGLPCGRCRVKASLRRNRAAVCRSGWMSEGEVFEVVGVGWRRKWSIAADLGRGRFTHRSAAVDGLVESVEIMVDYAVLSEVFVLVDCVGGRALPQCCCCAWGLCFRGLCGRIRALSLRALGSRRLPACLVGWVGLKHPGPGTSASSYCRTRSTPALPACLVGWVGLKPRRQLEWRPR